MNSLFKNALIFLLVLNVSCGKVKEKIDDPEKSHSKEWSYQGETSPEHWAEIEKNADCSGKRQSPVNILDIKTLWLPVCNCGQVFLHGQHHPFFILIIDPAEIH